MRNRLLITVLIMSMLALAASCKKNNIHPGSLSGTWVRFDASGHTWIFEVSETVYRDGTFCSVIEKEGANEVRSLSGGLNYDAGNGSGYIIFEASAVGAPAGKVSDATDDSINLVITQGSTSPMIVVQGVFTKEGK